MVALVVLGLCPGGWGFVEDAVHLVSEGHTVDAHVHVVAHNDSDGVADDGHEDHDGPGDEHGCSGAFHTCGCHVGAVFVVVAAAAPALMVPLVSVTDSRFGPVDGGAAGDVVGLDRPPRV